MKTTTLDLIKSVLKSDETISPDERARLVRALSGPGAPPVASRVVRFREAAARLGGRPWTARSYARSGKLQAVIVNQRRIGVTEESLEKLINGGAA
jgi:hypothetical protein